MNDVNSTMGFAKGSASVGRSNPSIGEQAQASSSIERIVDDLRASHSSLSAVVDAVEKRLSGVLRHNNGPTMESEKPVFRAECDVATAIETEVNSAFASVRRLQSLLQRLDL